MALALLAGCRTETTCVLSIPVVSTRDAHLAQYGRYLHGIEKPDADDRDIAIFLMALSPTGPIGKVEYSIERDFGDGDITYYATAIFDGVPDDDSISGYRYDFTLQLNEQRILKIVRAQESWRCWSGRGHRNFSIELCS